MKQVEILIVKMPLMKSFIKDYLKKLKNSKVVCIRDIDNSDDFEILIEYEVEE